MTIAALFGAVVVFSAIALQNLYVPDTANEDAAEATQEITQAPATTEETTALKGPQATTEEARCSQTRTFKDYSWLLVFTTNDVPGCPKGGLLSGTDNNDNLAGKDGEDEIRGLGAKDTIEGGDGNDVIYGGPGIDWLFDGNGEDVLYGGAGNDLVTASGLREDGYRDKVYCGPGKDVYDAGKLDYVDSSCEKKGLGPGGTN